MATKLRREKDILSRNVKNYVTATTKDYSAYFEGSPTILTYYQIAPEFSTVDNGLETTTSLIGSSSPIKYKKIFDVVSYSVDGMDITTEISERGLTASSSGEMVFRPDSVVPQPGDFFVFDYDGLRQHMFRITDVQVDRGSMEQYYKASYSIYPEDPSAIINNVIDDYELIYDNIGGKDRSVIQKETVDLANRAKLLVDSLISNYERYYYDEVMDSFVAPFSKMHSGIKVWSPYLQRFLYNNKVIDRYKREINADILVSRIDDANFPDIFSDNVYYDSFFSYIEKCDVNFNISHSFLSLSKIELSQQRNLPFFFDGAASYMLLDVCESNSSKSIDSSFHMLYGDINMPYSLSNQIGHVFSVNDPYSSDEVVPIIKDALASKKIKGGDIIYLRKNGTSNKVDAVYQVSSDEDNIHDISMKYMFSSKSIRDNADVFKDPYSYINIIKEYLLSKEHIVPITDKFLKALNRTFFERSITNYIFIPILIFALKDSIDIMLK